MDQDLKAKLAPRFVDGKTMVIAGLGQHMSSGTCDIGPLWSRFAPHIGRVPGQIGQRVAYGVVTEDGKGVDYLAGVEVSDVSRVPDGFTHVSLPAQRYAVFTHDAHVSKLKDTMDAIWVWWPGSGLVHARTPGAPAFFERYGEAFDPQPGIGGMEVWVPVKA